MMEHIRQFDWCAPIPESHFVEESDLDNCNTEKIIKNRFHDPLLSSESEDETPAKINWDEMFRTRKNHKIKVYVPCLRPVPQYPKLSALTNQQHYQILKVLSEENPHIAPDLVIHKPQRQDHKVYEAVKEIYLKEQKEYMEWAKTLWYMDHCIRALRPKPAVETVYEAEFKVKIQRMSSLPKKYDIAAQIPLESRRKTCDAVLKQELINVPLSDIPFAKIPENINKQFSILRPCAVPEPCQKHPYQFVLPNEKGVSVLPTSEIHRELALYALTNGAQYIASENALKCLMQQNRPWIIPVSVCETIGPDGDKVNVVVLDSEFSAHKEDPQMRTYKAFRHLLEQALIPMKEKEKLLKDKKKEVPSPVKAETTEDADMLSDDEDSMFICTDDNTDNTETESVQPSWSKRIDNKLNNSNLEKDSVGYITRAVSRKISEDVHDIGLYNCTCKDTIYEHPPRRSFKRWQFRSKSEINYDIIIHCPHKARSKTGELLIEPIVDYQLDLGASKQSTDSIRSLALSLMLRKNASVVLARVDGPTGEVASLLPMSADTFCGQHPGVSGALHNTLYTALGQLQGLVPGHYVLQHEVSHGPHALLLSPRGARGAALSLCGAAPPRDEDRLARKPPDLTPELLPYHKSRKLLPCAFTPYPNQLVRETKKPAPKKKAPPQAIKLQAEQPESGTTRKVPSPTGDLSNEFNECPT
ncbi:uncharacterized protein LOC113506657 isoform X1 [Trichoplusia ni]|uniref:Uncharacterized protein LOC113506657 isoform X1 n=1 Tax=Trichoplusia ni TaxID=7111 RepID=A0A7E5WXQ3_TRINI|nr:uncharacterized protein LOC113506657 isoform X1 [Trichoplusia ni]